MSLGPAGRANKQPVIVVCCQDMGSLLMPLNLELLMELRSKPHAQKQPLDNSEMLSSLTGASASPRRCANGGREALGSSTPNMEGCCCVRARE